MLLNFSSCLKLTLIFITFIFLLIVVEASNSDRDSNKQSKKAATSFLEAYKLLTTPVKVNILALVLASTNSCSTLAHRKEIKYQFFVEVSGRLQ